MLTHWTVVWYEKKNEWKKKTFCDKHNLTVQVLITSGCICKVSFEIVNALRQQQLHLYQTRKKKRNWIKKKVTRQRRQRLTFNYTSVRIRSNSKRLQSKWIAVALRTPSTCLIWKFNEHFYGVFRFVGVLKDKLKK